MRIEIGNQIRINKPSPELVQWCKKHLVLANPEYAKKMRMGFWVGNTPKTVSLMEWHGETLVLPYGFLSVMYSLVDPYFDVISTSFKKAESVNYHCNVPLFDYQREAVEALRKVYCGILQSPAASGKTQMGIALAAKLGKRTLWLTHTKDLLLQSKNRAEQYMDSSLLGTITEGKVCIGKGITFATVQTMSNLDLPRYRDIWDCVIVDECHRVAGTPTAVTQFSKVLNALAARYKYGLSATVHRADGMIAATYALLGKVVYQVSSEAVRERVMPVSVCLKSTDVLPNRVYLDTDGTMIYAKLINYLTEHEERNKQIVGDLLQNGEQYNLILSARLGHLRKLMNLLPPSFREQAVMVDGKEDKAVRKQALEDMRSGKKHYLFATYSLAKEGLDIPRLDRLYLVTPQKDYAVITQSVGRIARTFEGKGEPIVYDYVDTAIRYLLKTYKQRCTTYRKLNCSFI